MALVAAAGPGANLIMLALWTLLLSVLFATGNPVSYMSTLLIEMAQVGIHHQYRIDRPEPVALASPGRQPDCNGFPFTRSSAKV